MPQATIPYSTVKESGIAPLDHDHRVIAKLLLHLDRALQDDADQDGALYVLDSLVGHTMSHIEREMMAMNLFDKYNRNRVLHYAVMGEELSALRAQFVKGGFWNISDLFMAQLRALYGFSFRHFCTLRATVPSP